MRYIDVETINGIVRRPVYAINEVAWNDYLMSKTVRKHKTEYLNIPVTFDIETTNMQEGYTNTGKPKYYAFMYHWQFCIGEHVIFGRYWDEYIHLIDVMKHRLLLSPSRMVVIYVHNLSFEYQFIKRFFKFTEPIVSSGGNIIRVLCDGCIEYRCSAMLSNMGLQKFCENSEGVTFWKNDKDTYNYAKIRNPETPMLWHELSYCYCDVYGLKQCIESRLKTDTITSIPLTSTGYVRRRARESMKTNPHNREIFLETQLTPELYTLLTEIFRGGDVHANLRWSRQLLHNLQSFDMQSAYPAVMLEEKFPMTRFTKCSVKNIDKLHGKYAYICRMRFENIRFKANHGDPYIPISKCTKFSKNRVVDNGRILQAEFLDISICDIDYEIIKECYEWDSVFVKDLYFSKYDYLPKELTDVIIEYFEKKTGLKGIKEHIYEYNKSKNELNALYGMMVSALVRSIFDVLSNGDILDMTAHALRDEGMSAEEKEEYKRTILEKGLFDYYKNRNSFLPYQWGVYVTAHCRRRLHKGITIMGKNHVYNDTDSAKGKGDHTKEFEELNKEIIAKAIEKGAYAKDRKGNIQYMGVWENEGVYSQFKTLGAKKYLVEKAETPGDYESTIAGVSKEKGQKYFEEHGFEAFDIGTTITDSGHLMAHYNEDNIHMITVNGCTFKTASNVALVEGGYTLGVTNEYLDLLEQIATGIYSQGRS